MQTLPSQMFRVLQVNRRHTPRKFPTAFIVLCCVAFASSSCSSSIQQPKSVAAVQKPNPVPQAPVDMPAQKTLAPMVHVAPQIMTDPQISNAVDYTLLSDVALSSSQVDVAVSSGIVTLTGVVNNLMTKERATRLAQTIRGVRAVVNTLVLKPVARSDYEIRKDAQSALLYDAATDSYPIKLEVRDGVVTLSGIVPSHSAKRLAINIVEGVKGVKGVKDSLELDSAKRRSDTEIAAEVERAIATDVWLHPNTIKTSVHDGTVTLSGIVGSSAQYDRANELAWTAGVKSVHSEGLMVDPWSKSPSLRSNMAGAADDPLLKQAVMDALLFDPRVSSFNAQVDVKNGIVTLTGKVDNLKSKRAAEQDAKNTWGVWSVMNLLKIRPFKEVTDDKLGQNVAAALLRDPVVSNFEIQVKARNGLLSLTGTVDSIYEKALADDIASRANGVVGVRNNLTVVNPMLIHHDLGFDPYWASVPSYAYSKGYRLHYYPPGPSLSDAALKDIIEKKIMWSPWLALDDITVTVSNGAVTLSGHAGSVFEIRKAADYAYEAGALQVDNIIAEK